MGLDEKGVVIVNSKDGLEWAVPIRGLICLGEYDPDYCDLVPNELFYPLAPDSIHRFKIIDKVVKLPILLMEEFQNLINSGNLILLTIGRMLTE